MSGNCLLHQRELTVAVKREPAYRARELAEEISAKGVVW
ncbi:MAG: hypothetical protein U0231_09755 [Nitrospiraceae bacterium]